MKKAAHSACSMTPALAAAKLVVWKWMSKSTMPMTAVNSASSPAYWAMRIEKRAASGAGRSARTTESSWFSSRAFGLQRSWQRASSEQQSEQIGAA